MKNTQKGSALLVTILIVVILASVVTLFFSQQLFRSETMDEAARSQQVSKQATPDISTSTVESTGPSITLLSPNGGEVVKMGQKYEITWMAQSVGKVSISLVSGGKDFGLVTEKSSVKASDGKFMWTVPDMKGWYESGVSKNNFRLYITSDGTPSVGDMSDATFTIE